MIKKICKFIPVIFLILFLSSCSKDPNSVGEDLLTDKDNLIGSNLSVISTSSSEYSVKSSNNTIVLMIGKYQDGDNLIEARTLIKFTATTVDSVFLNSIINTEIKLQPVYSMPDTAGLFSFTVHKMLKSWSDYSFTIDSLTADSYDQNSIHEYDLTLNAKDTLPAKFKINTDVVKEWLKGSENFGLIFIPKPNSNFIFGFKSSDLYTFDAPELIITYQLPEDTSSKTLILKVQQDATVFSGKIESSSPNLLTLQGGLLQRAKLNFSVDTIPRSASILEAKMVLYIDTVFSRFSPFSSKKLLVQEIISADSIPKLGSISVDNIIIGDSVVVNIQQIVQKWIAGKPNYGIALRAFNEFTEVDRIAIYNSSSTKPPKIQIRYLRLP